jgi:hypothetical protein
MEQNPPIVPLTPRPNWWIRNWKWFVPVGCFGTLTLVIAFVVSIAVIVFSAVKSTDVYKDALARAKAHPSVIEILGSPIKEGFLVSGNTNVNGASGEANLSIPSLARKEKERSTWQQPNRLADGTILVSLWRSRKRISESTSWRALFRQIRPDRSRAARYKETFRQRDSFRNSRGDYRHRGRIISWLRFGRSTGCGVSCLHI